MYSFYILVIFTVRTAKLAFVDSVAKPPREVRRQQARFGTVNAITKRNKMHAVDMISVGRANQQVAERGVV